REVELMHDGSVRLRVRSDASGGAGAEPALRSLLLRTLEVSSSVGPALRRAAERREEVGLPSLVRELEVALIPVNRGAAKRALSRLHRETERARDAGKLAALLSAEEAAPVVAAPVVAAPVVAAESFVAAPVVVAQPVLVAAPVVVAAPVSASPVAASPVEVSEPPPAALPLEVSEPPPAALPHVMAAPPRRPPAPAVELTLTPAPRSYTSEREPALTKPEPVVLRAKERGSSTPRLGTVVTAQTLPGDEVELTERAPEIELDDEEIEVEIDVELEPERAEDVETPVRAVAVLPQPLVDPEPSSLPDVLTAMLELHTGLDADEAPTRLREVVTELLAIVQPVPLFTPEPQDVEETWLTESSLADIVTSAPLLDANEPAVERRAFVSELADPETHEAVTLYPGPVTSATPLPPELLIAEQAPQPSPYAPAVLPTSSSDVSELVDSFYVSGGAEDALLRSTLKEMAGLDLTPLPHPYIDER
ncbi:MAG TPA: hypothetical protein VEQ59_05515, partial [Polyangiaceae bacterium]|nr:hypothetical protein [Polyangiaceae bacterium]